MTPEKQLDRLLAKFTPEVATVARAARAKLRRLLPGAIELVYDNYNALAIGFGPTERASDAILSIALYPRWVSLFLLHGATLPDPEGLLKGGGKVVRHIVLDRAATLDTPGIRKLIEVAVARGKPLHGPHRLIIKSVSTRQRPRQPATRGGATRRPRSGPRS